MYINANLCLNDRVKEKSCAKARISEATAAERDGGDHDASIDLFAHCPGHRLVCEQFIALLLRALAPVRDYLGRQTVHMVAIRSHPHML